MHACSHACAYVYVHALTRACMPAYTCLYVYRFARILTRTRTHTCTPAWLGLPPSNTLMLEMCYGLSGVCVDPLASEGSAMRRALTSTRPACKVCPEMDGWMDGRIDI